MLDLSSNLVTESIKSRWLDISMNVMCVYDAMKEKRQLNNLLVRFRAMQRPAVSDVCFNCIMCIGWSTT